MRIFGIGFGLLASAFSPLLVALVLVSQPLQNPWGNAALALLFALPALLLVTVFRAATSLQSTRLTLVQTTPKDVDVIAFLSSYLVPIAIALFSSDAQRWVAMAVLLVILVVIYLSAELYYLNPLLACAGFRLYQVVDDAGNTVALLTRRRELPRGSVVDARRIATTIYLELGSRR
jgi:hypothetical protein